jgi:hypothetical protein
MPSKTFFRTFLVYWLPVLGWAGLIFYLSSIAYLRIVEGPWDFWIRKAGHMAVYGILARLTARAFVHSIVTWSWKRIFTVSLVACALYACSDEYHQTFVQGRSGSARDVTLDTLGAWLSLGLLP